MQATANTQADNLTCNGFSLVALQDVVEQVQSDPSLALTAFRVSSEWKGAARVEANVKGYELGGQAIARKHTIHSDEPRELLGEDTGPNPQELLFAALNACMIFGYVSKAAAMGIEVERLSIETHGSLDLRGPLGLAEVAPGMEQMHYTVRIKAKASKEQLEELHQGVMSHSPNRFHMTHPIQLLPKLVIE
jgi:uncharacterized OsmC-like protein